MFSELSSFCILSTYMLFLSLKTNLNEIKSSQYRPCPTQNPLFTSGSQYPPRSTHAVHLGDQQTTQICKFYRHKKSHGNIFAWIFNSTGFEGEYHVTDCIFFTFRMINRVRVYENHPSGQQFLFVRYLTFVFC